MKRIILITILGLFGIENLATWAATKDDSQFAPNVHPETGEISVPAHYREWPTLGTWAHAKVEGGSRLAGISRRLYSAGNHQLLPKEREVSRWGRLG